VSPDRSVSVALGCGLHDPGSIHGKGERWFSAPQSPKPYLVFSQPAIHSINHALASYQTGMWPGRQTDHAPLSSAEVKNGGVIPPFPNMSSFMTLRLYFKSTYKYHIISYWHNLMSIDMCATYRSTTIKMIFSSTPHPRKHFRRNTSYIDVECGHGTIQTLEYFLGDNILLCPAWEENVWRG
jgi:hypothetical protein